MHIRRSAFSSILSVLYGKRCPRYETKDATDFFEVEELWEEAVSVGNSTPVDLIPILKYVPEQMGASWKGLLRKIKRLQKCVHCWDCISLYLI